MNAAIERSNDEKIGAGDIGSEGCEHSQLQEQQALADEAAQRQTSGTPLFDNRPESKEADGTDHPSFRVTATFYFSDRRRRDAHGAYETVADCLIAAVRRLLDSNPGHNHKGAVVRTGKGRRRAVYREAFVAEGPVPF